MFELLLPALLLATFYNNLKISVESFRKVNFIGFNKRLIINKRIHWRNLIVNI